MLIPISKAPKNQSVDPSTLRLITISKTSPQALLIVRVNNESKLPAFTRDSGWVAEKLINLHSLHCLHHPPVCIYMPGKGRRKGGLGKPVFTEYIAWPWHCVEHCTY